MEILFFKNFLILGSLLVSIFAFISSIYSYRTMKNTLRIEINKTMEEKRKEFEKEKHKILEELEKREKELFK